MPKTSTKSVKGKAKGLNPQQKNFCRFYVSGMNGTQSAITVGYTEKSAHVAACRLLKDDNIQKEIKRLQDNLNKNMMNQVVLTRERWLSEMMKVGLANYGEYAKFKGNELSITDTDKLDEDQQAAIAEMGQTVTQHGGSVRIKLHDKNKALIEIGKAQGWYIQPSGDGDGNGPSISVTVQMPSNGRDTAPRPASAVAKAGSW